MIDDSLFRLRLTLLLVTLLFDSLGDVGLTGGVVWGWSMSGAGRGIWLLIPLMVLVGDWRESCYF